MESVSMVNKKEFLYLFSVCVVFYVGSELKVSRFNLVVDSDDDDCAKDAVRLRVFGDFSGGEVVKGFDADLRFKVRID